MKDKINTCKKRQKLMPKKRKINNYSALQKQYFFLVSRRINSSPGSADNGQESDRFLRRVFFFSVAHVLGVLLLYEISYETTNARNYAHTFARLDIREDNAGVALLFLEAMKERKGCEIQRHRRVSINLSFSAHNRHVRRYKNNAYRRVVIQYERHAVHVSEITRLGLVIATECKIRAGGPAPTGNYSAAQFRDKYISIFLLLMRMRQYITDDNGRIKLVRNDLVSHNNPHFQRQNTLSDV